MRYYFIAWTLFDNINILKLEIISSSLIIYTINQTNSFFLRFDEKVNNIQISEIIKLGIRRTVLRNEICFHLFSHSFSVTPDRVQRDV